MDALPAVCIQEEAELLLEMQDIRDLFGMDNLTCWPSPFKILSEHWLTSSYFPDLSALCHFISFSVLSSHLVIGLKGSPILKGSIYYLLEGIDCQVLKKTYRSSFAIIKSNGFLQWIFTLFNPFLENHEILQDQTSLVSVHRLSLGTLKMKFY